MHPADGLRLVHEVDGPLSSIEDFDGVATIEDRWPGELQIESAEWAERQPEEAVLAACKSRYPITVKAVAPLFLPAWRARLDNPKRGADRVVLLDALTGRPLPF